MLSPDSSSLDVTPIREMLRLYSRALSERDVDILDSQRLAEKNIGWTNSDVATSDGKAIFLPSRIDRFQSRAENFDFLKVMVTQQTGHLEFGTFTFDFERASTSFHDWRPRLETQLESVDNGGRAPAPTEFSRFFRLFADTRLALDIFSIVESARTETRIMHLYRGIAPTYRLLRKRALAARQEIGYLPAQEALLEFMARLTLDQRGPINVPSEHAAVAVRIGALLQTGCVPTATVEDAAEATLRIYGLLSVIVNEYLERFSPVVLDKVSSAGARAADPQDFADWTRVNFLRTFPPGRKKDYCPPQGIDYRGELKPELAQLLTRDKPHAHEQCDAVTPEELVQILRRQGLQSGNELNGAEDKPQIEQSARNLTRELQQWQPGARKVQPRPWLRAEEETGPLSASQPNTYVYDEWDAYAQQYRPRWCKVCERTMASGDLNFYLDTLRRHTVLLEKIRREFEQVAPEMYHREKRLVDGTEHDLDAAIEALSDFRLGITPSEKIFWRHHKRERDVAVALLLDMSGSTGETIAAVSNGAGAWSGDETSDAPLRSSRRIIDVEKEAIVMMTSALGDIGDRYGVYGFSGHGRENVEFFAIKEFEEEMSPHVSARFGRIEPLHATRMGPAIRHATMKLSRQQTRSKYLFLISDGRPQDRGYSQESSEKVYAVEDTRMALLEGRRQGIRAFCLTVDKEGNDYLRTMMGEFGYEVLADVAALPQRLLQLYRKLTS